MFDNSSYKTFNYEGFSLGTNSVIFRYSASGVERLDFNDTVVFPVSVQNRNDLEDLFNLAGVVLGLSYYKAFAGAVYNINTNLTNEGVDFLESAIHYGLGEFCYKNNIPLLANVIKTRTKPSLTPVASVEDKQPLVAVGGGKDSIVSLEALTRAGIYLKCIAVNPIVPHVNSARTAGAELVEITHKIDDRILKLNREGALNGHVPVTAFNSLIMVIASRLLDAGLVILSNEKSADMETTVWMGESINHQWSKSSEAEELLNRAVASVTGIKQTAVSILRNHFEIEIAEAFALNCGRYNGVMVSCNRAYKIYDKNGVWCGDCDKCRFVALILAPFMSRETLESVVDFIPFQMSELGEYMKLVVKEDKPFECVGDIHESRKAFSLLASHPDWKDSPLVVSVNKAIATMEDIPDYSAFSPKNLPYKEAVDAFFG